MSAPATVPARFYPAGGDAHGHPASLAWDAGHLLVSLDDAPAHRVPAAALRIEARGFNHSQWSIAWPGDGGDALLIVDDAAAAPLRDAAPPAAAAQFTRGQTTRQATHRRFGLGILLLIALPLLLLAGLMLAIEPLADRVVAHTPAAVEAQIGDAVLARTRAEGRMITDGPAFEALQTIGKRLARPGETLQFHLAGRADINAFAAPGGVVVVYSGLMKKAASAEEVAGVLAHEIAHVELRHSLRQLVRSAGLRVILAAAAGDYAALGGWAAQLGELKFSRDAEREADARGLERLAEARIAPGGMLRFFETLAELEAERPGQLPALFSTHPATAERLARLRAAVPPGNAAPTEAIAVDWPAVQRALPKE